MSTIPQDLILPFEKPTVITDELGGTAKEVCIVFPDNQTAGVFALVLAPKDAEGNWDRNYTPRLARKEDDLTSENPMERLAASTLISMLFKGSVVTQGLDALTDGLIQAMLAQGVDIRGHCPWDAAKLILPKEHIQ